MTDSNDPIASDLAILIERVLYLENYPGDRPSRWRVREREALEWALRELGQRWPKQLAEAERIAEARQLERRT